MTTLAHAEETDRPKKTRRPWRRTKITLLVVVAIALVVAIVGSVTPWPSALVIRSVFTQGGDATAAEMDKHVSDTDLTETADVAYGDGGVDETMDVFTPASADGPLPTIVWVHGGAWISGSKENVDPYLRILAAEGYTTIAVNYTIGPEAYYPTAVHQLNEALSYIDEHAEELNVDASQIVLAGDSAGAQLASQLATLITSSDYAEMMDLTPALSPDQVVATVLNCGVYDLSALAELDGILGWGFKSAMWAYSGTRTWAEDSTGAHDVDHRLGDIRLPHHLHQRRQRRRPHLAAVHPDGAAARHPRGRRHDPVLARTPRAGAAARVPVPPRHAGCPNRPREDGRLPRRPHHALTRPSRAPLRG